MSSPWSQLNEKAYPRHLYARLRRFGGICRSDLGPAGPDEGTWQDRRGLSKAVKGETLSTPLR
jgi:hypothetical protein